MAQPANPADAKAILWLGCADDFGRRMVGKRVTNDALCLYLKKNKSKYIFFIIRK